MVTAVPALPTALSLLFLDALTQAGQRLAELVQRDIVFRGARAAYVRLEELPLCHENGPDAPVTAVYPGFSGGMDGHVVLSMTPAAARHLAGLLLMCDDDLETPTMRYLADSAVGEIANVAASAFLTAVADAAQLTVWPTPPCVVHDMWAAVLQSVVVEIVQEQVSGILVEVHLIVEGQLLGGTLVLLPSVASCLRLAEALALRGAS